MAKAGYVDSSVRGVWSLTGLRGELQDLTPQQALEIFKQVRLGMGNDHAQTDAANVAIDVSDTGEGSNSVNDYRVELLQFMQGISAAGFEQLCQRLLRESGFERVP